MRMNINVLRLRCTTASILFALACVAPSRAWCANLWISFVGSVESYTSRQLKTSGMPTPIHLSLSGGATGLAFDMSHDLWGVSGDGTDVVRFTAMQLKNLKKDPSPTPGVVITSASTFVDIIGCAFDPQGNLWVVDGNDRIAELSKAQLAAGSGDLTPAVVISSLALDFPVFVTFDAAGNAWIDSADSDEIVEFTATQLTSGGQKAPSIVISDDGSGTSISEPGELAFDRQGNLWVPNRGANTVVEYAKNQLNTSGNPAPIVKLSGAIFHQPWGEAFDSAGNLVVMNYANGTIAKFSAKQLKMSGAPTPRISVTGANAKNFQIIFGPSS
jgi:hypothetical protein